MAARFLDSTIGKKVVMAVTGLILVGFVVGHGLVDLLRPYSSLASPDQDDT